MEGGSGVNGLTEEEVWTGVERMLSQSIERTGQPLKGLAQILWLRGLQRRVVHFN